MSALIPLKEFSNRFLTKPITKISGSFKKLTPEILFLPDNSVIHFIAETTTELGIDKSYSLLRNVYADTTIYHVSELKAEVGAPVLAKANISNLKISYHRSHLDIKEISNLDRSLTVNKLPIVLNYAILAKLYTYKSGGLSDYHDWYNIRATMWDRINQIGSRREHFIRFKLPQHLPTKNELNKYLSGFKLSGLADFHTKEGYDILELWQIIHPEVVTPVTKIDETILNNVFITFVESGIIVVLCLGDLIEWSNNNYEATSDGLYKFLDNLIGLRTSVSGEVLEKESKLIGDTDLTIDTNSAIVRLINQHGEAGNLSGREQTSLLKLSQKYKTILDPHGSGKTLDQMVVSEEDCQIDRDKLINDPNNVLSKNMLVSSIHSMEKKYVKDVMPKDLVQSILKLQDGGIIIKDLKASKKLDAANKLWEYSVSTIPISGDAAPFKFTIPVIEEDGTFLLNGTKYRMDKQKGEMPIVKTKPNVVALTSYYGKIFIVRTASSALNYAKWISKVLLNNDNKTNKEGTVSNLTYGISIIKDKVPRAYSAIAETFRSFTILGQYNFTFTYNKIDTLFTKVEIKVMHENNLIPCGRDTKTNTPIGMDDFGKLYEIILIPGNGLERDGIIYLGTIPNLINEDLGNGPNEFTEMELFNKRIPIILALMYQYGLEGTLSYLRTSYTLEPINVRQVYDPNKYILKCKDTAYVIDISNPYHRLVISGLYSMRDISTRYRSIDFNHKQTYASIFAHLGLTVHHLREISLMWDMFIEPITEGLLKTLNQPTNFKDLILYSSDLLIDDHMPETNTVRYKGYERICGMLYRELVVAMREHRAKGSSSGLTFTLNPNAVLLSLQQDQTIGLVEESNPIHNLKEKESITHVGAGGRNADTMMKDARGFTKNDFGILSESTPDSGKVGIRAYLTPDADFSSIRGTTNTVDSSTEKNTVKCLSTSLLLSGAGNHDDGKRANFTGIQNSHTVGCETYDPTPYRTGYEEVIAGRVDEMFAVKAEDDGVVVNVTPEILSVEYKNHGKKNYEIGIRHGVVSGTTVPHNRITDLIVGQKFKKLDILIFDSGFFQRSEINTNNVVYKPGALCRVAFIDNSATNEDGALISNSFAKKLYTSQTKVHGLIIDFDTIIHNLVSVNAELDPETILCTLEGFVSDELQTKDPAAIAALTKISANNPKAKVYGKITNIEVIYYGKLEDMHSSLQKIAIKFDNQRVKKINNFGTDHARSGRITESIRVSGMKLEPNQMAIKIYIDTLLDMNAGDKLVVCHQLKSTVSSVVTDPMIAEDGTEIDLEFGMLSVSNRIVESAIRVGMVSAILQAGTLEMARIYNS